MLKDLCIKLHSRTLASSHYRVSLEIYINLVEHLHEYFKDKELEKRSLKTTFDISTTENNFLLRIVRVLFFFLFIANQANKIFFFQIVSSNQ